MRGSGGTPWRAVLQRAVVLGPVGGAVIAELTLWEPALRLGGWNFNLGDLALMAGWTVAVGWIGSLVGLVEAMLALTAVLLLGPLRRCAPVAIVVGGAAAAAIPLWLTFRDGWPRIHGSPGGLALCGAAFLAGALLIWPVLTGRPWLPPGMDVTA